MSLSKLVYNQNGIAVVQEGAYWDNAAQKWGSFWRNEYDYLEGLKMLDANLSKTNEEEDWKIYSRKYYYYKGINVYVPANFIENQVKVYPNPARDIIIVSQKMPQKNHD